MSDHGSHNLNGSVATPQEKNLLDNVSLMTTLSPMPSNNTSLRPDGTSTQELLDGLFGNVKEHALPATAEDNQVSTFDDMQEKLRAQLDGDSTDGATTELNTGTGKIMYGFDLSPIHSVDKASAYTSTQEEPPTTEKLNRRGDFAVSTNFMQSQGSSHPAKSQKSIDNNDTETMMSQVFSSQDAVSSPNDVDKMKSDRKDEASKSEQKVHDLLKSTASMKSKKTDSKLIKTHTGTTRPSPMNQKTTRDTLSKFSSKGKIMSQKSPTKKTSKTTEFIIPKSPESRQAAVKVTPRIKNTPKNPNKKVTSISTKSAIQNKSSTTRNHKISERSEKVKSIIRSQASNLSGEKTDFPDGILGKQNHDETLSLIHILEDLNQMRSQVADSQERLHAVSQEKHELLEKNKKLLMEVEQMKMGNFVLKSRLDKFAAGSRNKITEIAVENESEPVQYDRVDMERLIMGYQKENEKIYDDLKKLKQSNKDTEQAMYEENLRLRSEIAQLKEELTLRCVIKKAQAGNVIESNVPVEDSGVDKDDGIMFRKKIQSLENQLKAEEGLKMKSDLLVRKLTEERDNAEKRIVENNCKYEEAYDKLITNHKADIVKLETELGKVRRSLHDKADAAITIRDIMSTPPSKSLLTHFQKRAKKLEEELESRDAQANHAIASVQKQYSEIRIKYEKRIDDLEKQIQLFRENADTDQHKTNESETLKKQLSEALLKLKVEADHRRVERDTLFEQINILRQQQLASAENNSMHKNSEAELIKECKSKDQEIAKLNAMVEKCTAPRTTQSKKMYNENKQRQTYNPGSFEGEGYASLIEMNKQLRKQLQDKELELKHVDITKDATITKLEQEIKSQKLLFEKEVNAVREKMTHHKSESENVEKLKVSQLENELQKRYVEISELKNDLSNMTVFKIREQALQTQVQQLLSQVREARTSSPSSGARRVALLEDKLRILEEKLKIREMELNRLQFGNASSDLLSRLHSTQSELERKNQEMTRFRLELDSILLVLKELHSQGIQIPLPKHLHSIF